MRFKGFKKEITKGRYLNAFKNFDEKEVVIELRYDEITDVACRILPYRVRTAHKPDVDAYPEKSPASLCPFCSPLFEKTTPNFMPSVTTEGKFRHGEAWLFPNAFPYDANNCVAILSSRHFIPMDELTPGTMKDSFEVCRDYFHRLAEMNLGYKYCSINWNYMPPAGGGLIHPHLQTIVSQKPTNLVQRLISSAQSYAAENEGDCLWQTMLAMEKDAQERFITNTGAISWLASFAPKSMAGEIDFYFHEKTSFFDLTEANLDEMLAGLAKVFGYLYANNFISFNLSLYAPMLSNRYLWVQGKITPRFELNPLGTSDLNYFEKLHNEIICPVVPEDLCKEIRAYFAAS